MKKEGAAVTVAILGVGTEESVVYRSRLMDSEQTSKASPERPVFLIPFYLPLLFGFFLAKFLQGGFRVAGHIWKH